MTFRKALETSNNLVTLKIGLDLGLASVNSFFNPWQKNEYHSDKPNTYNLRKMRPSKIHFLIFQNSKIY